jgi:hypothetical protein
LISPDLEIKAAEAMWRELKYSAKSEQIRAQTRVQDWARRAQARRARRARAWRAQARV